MLNKPTPVIQNGKIIGHVRSWKQATTLLQTNATMEYRIVDGQKYWCYTDK